MSEIRITVKTKMEELSKQASALISIYDAANDSDGWDLSLDLCVNYVEAHSANILFHETEQDSNWKYSFGSQKWRSCTEDQMSRTIMMFEKYDSSAWEFVYKHEKQTLLVDTDFWRNEKEIESREDYLFFRNELGFVRKVGSRLNDHRCWNDNLAFQFPVHMKQIPRVNLNRIRTLLPHAAKSIELWRTFALLKSQYKAVLSALDHVKIGLCIAIPGGTIIVANDEANRIFDTSSVLKIGKDKCIHCKDEAMHSGIKSAIETICATAAGRNVVTESFHVLEPKDTAPLSIEVSPLRDSAVEISSRFNGALITIIDLSSALQVDCSKLASAYQLSRSEAAVCQLVINGMAAHEIADMRNVSPETIKSQIKTVYRKTGTQGRINLVRLATKAHPPVE